MINEFLIYFYFILILFAVNTYLFYPLLMILLRKIIPLQNPPKHEPTISILISAYNEEKVIAQRIKNIASLDYDFSKLEVLIGSDSSTDMTNEILRKLSSRYDWLKVFTFEKRRGKAGVLNNLMKKARNEILVFTDANTVFDKNQLKYLVRHFKKEKTGGVCGKLILTDNETIKKQGVEEKKYWDFEIILKEGEGRLGRVIGANGGNFAIRKKLAREIPIDKPVTDDLFLSLAVLEQGSKFVYEPRSLAFEEVGKDIRAELKRKIRFAATNFQTFLFMKRLLFNKDIILSYFFFSHKVSRWFFPFVMLLIFVTNCFLLKSNPVFTTLFFIQMFFYLSAAFGFLFNKLKVRFPLFSLAYFFMLANYAIVAGFVKFMLRKHSVIWDSTER